MTDRPLPPDPDGTWQGEPHPPPPDDPHGFDIVDLSSPSTVDEPEDPIEDETEEVGAKEPGLDPNMAALREEQRKGSVIGASRLYDQGSYGIDADSLNSVLIALCTIAAFICLTMFFWHTVDQHTAGYIEKQHTAVQLSKERADVAAACQHDEQPRICIERVIPPGQQ